MLVAVKPKSKNGLRIVSLAPSATSILHAVGARRTLVGVTKWCADVADASGLPRVGDCWHMGSVDEILRLHPSLVIGSVPYKTETVAKLLEHPVNFLATNPRTLADVYRDIRMLAGLVNRAPTGERLIAQMQKQFVSLALQAERAIRASGSRKPVRIYCEAWPNPRISSPPWVAELAQFCGAEMVVPAGQRVRDDDVAAAAPDVIVLAWAATGTKAKIQRAYDVPSWKNVPAVRNRHVFVIADELLNTPGPPLVAGAKQLSKIVRAVLAGKTP